MRYGSEAQASKPIWPSASETFDRKNKVMRAQKKLIDLKRRDGKTVASLSLTYKRNPGASSPGVSF